MNEWKEIAVAWGIAAALLIVGIEMAEIASGQPHVSAAPVAVRFAEGLPSPQTDRFAPEDDFR
jgi:hypothetical protein